MDEAQEKGLRKHRAYRGPKNKFLHDLVALDLMDLRHARLIDGVPAIWDGLDERYVLGYDAWGRAVIELCEDATNGNRKEVFEYLRLVAPSCNQGNTHLIACSNGVIDPWDDGFGKLNDEGAFCGFFRNNPDLNITSVLPVAWNPFAYDEATDEALDAFANGDQTVRVNLEEILAACVYRGRELQNMAVICGGGGNGKSSFVHMLCGLLGKDNYAAIDLREVGQKFMTIQLAGKLANFGDDISDGIISADQLAIVKKIVTGEPLTVDVKYNNPLTIRPYCTLVFTTNSFPRLADYSTGMLDRIFGIQFTADFRHSNHRVTDIESRLDTDVSRAYLLNLALKRLPALVKRGAFTPSDFSRSMRSDTLLDNDSVCYWISAECVTTEQVIGQTVAQMYRDYRDFCENAGRKPCEQRTFARRVNERLETQTGKGSSGGRSRVFLPRDAR